MQADEPFGEMELPYQQTTTPTTTTSAVPVSGMEGGMDRDRMGGGYNGPAAGAGVAGGAVALAGHRGMGERDLRAQEGGMTSREGMRGEVLGTGVGGAGATTGMGRERDVVREEEREQQPGMLAKATAAAGAAVEMVKVRAGWGAVVLGICVLTALLDQGTDRSVLQEGTLCLIHGLHAHAWLSLDAAVVTILCRAVSTAA